MRSLVYLQEGVLAENKDIVSSYIDELDLRTANEEMVKAGEKFGFNTVKVYEKVYGSLAEISTKLGYLDPSSYGSLLKKWEIYTPSLWGGSVVNTEGSSVKSLNLAKMMAVHSW